MKKYIITAASYLIITGSVYSFEGKIFSVKGKNAVIVGQKMSLLKSGEKFSIYDKNIKTGEIVIHQVSHTNAKGKVVSGYAKKNFFIKKESNKKIQKKKYEYIDNGDGTVEDRISGLIWQKCSGGQKNNKKCRKDAKVYTYEEAVELCGALELAEMKWRLPSKEELKSLVFCSDGSDSGKLHDAGSGHPNQCGWSGGKKYDNPYTLPTITKDFFPNTAASPYWSFSGNHDSKAWLISFSIGYTFTDSKTNKYYVKCVAI